jgi:hypothetical protein
VLLVSVYFLNPFKVHNGNHSNKEIYIFGNINSAIFYSSMKALIEKQIAVLARVLPGRKLTCLLPKGLSLFVRMKIEATTTVSFFAIIFEGLFNFVKMVCLGTKMTKVVVSFFFLLRP